MAKACMVLIVVLLIHISSRADGLRLSFLNDQGALQSTVEVLKKSGCSDEAITSFQKAVEHYNAAGLRFDLSKFPSAQHGFYTFQSLSGLLSVLPRRLQDTPHAFEFNCLDNVILLGDGQLRTGLHPDDHPGEFLPAAISTNGDIVYAHVATAKDAFAYSMPTWYRDASADYIPSSMADSRICLTAAFYCFHTLPKSVTDKNVSDVVMKVLQTSWKKQAIEFPSSFQIVLCHSVLLSKDVMLTGHTGILFPVEKGYVYIEKVGGCGPFVRLDFSDRSNLTAWLAAKFDKTMGDFLFVTFNDKKIEMLHVGS
jgi:hypothetical protein